MVGSIAARRRRPGCWPVALVPGGARSPRHGPRQALARRGARLRPAARHSRAFPVELRRPRRRAARSTERAGFATVETKTSQIWGAERTEVRMDAGAMEPTAVLRPLAASLVRLLDVALEPQAARRTAPLLGLQQEGIEAAAPLHGLQGVGADAQAHLALQRVADQRHVDTGWDGTCAWSCSRHGCAAGPPSAACPSTRIAGSWLETPCRRPCEVRYCGLGSRGRVLYEQAAHVKAWSAKSMRRASDFLLLALWWPRHTIDAKPATLPWERGLPRFALRSLSCEASVMRLRPGVLVRLRSAPLRHARWPLWARWPAGRLCRGTGMARQRSRPLRRQLQRLQCRHLEFHCRGRAAELHAGQQRAPLDAARCIHLGRRDRSFGLLVNQAPKPAAFTFDFKSNLQGRLDQDGLRATAASPTSRTCRRPRRSPTPFPCASSISRACSIP